MEKKPRSEGGLHLGPAVVTEEEECVQADVSTADLRVLEDF